MAERRPNVVIFLADDLGYSDIGCFGGEIATPHLDQLAAQGLRASSCYNTARCSPSRASLLTGRHPHETGVGVLTENLAPFGAYPGTMSRDFPTIAERLRAAGYRTCLSGKWHLSSNTRTPDEFWPTRRGFEEFFGIMPGADSYFHPKGLWHNEEHLPVPAGEFYLTDAIADHAAGFVAEHSSEPFFLYVAFNAPHWPLHAPEEEVAPYQDVYERGWDELRTERYRRLQASGVLGPEAALSERDPSQPAWDDATDHAWEARRMAVYAAQVQLMDAAVGRIMAAIKDRGLEEDTIVIFLSDNGACAESLPPERAPHFLERNGGDTPDGLPVAVGNSPQVNPGPRTTYCSYGRTWANLSNTPFRLYKRWVHEGGISTPFIMSWPAGHLRGGMISHEPFQLIDILPTLLDAAGVDNRDDVIGHSMLPTFSGDSDDGQEEHTLFWEHVGNCAARRGRWKIVREADHPWELYDMVTDRSETCDRADEYPDVVSDLAAQWQEWADAVGVVPWEKLKPIVEVHGG